MEKNERLAWRTKPRTYCFSSCPKRHCKRETLPNCKLKKKQLFRPQKVVFSFSLPHTLGSRHEAFQVPFPAAQSATAKGDPSKLQIKKTTFQAPKSCFFIFPSRHSWEQARSFSGAFSSYPERHCKGRPFQLQIKKQLFGLRKVVFSKSLSPRHALFSPTGSKKKNFSGSEKLFFSKAVLSARNALS